MAARGEGLGEAAAAPRLGVRGVAGAGVATAAGAGVATAAGAGVADDMIIIGAVGSFSISV